MRHAHGALHAAGRPTATLRHGPHPPLQGRTAAGPGPGGRLRVRGHDVRLAQRRGQGDHRVALQRQPLLPPGPERRSPMTSNPNPAAPTGRTVRCAVYTRKSTEEGLDQDFNSLDAQRESAEAYVASQRHDGWICLPGRYDDGGFTGGNMERPALQRLLADIEAGQVDCVVTYKVDRLSRSLLDFAKMMGRFEEH